MYGSKEAQILLDAFDKIWDNPILSADYVIDVWEHSLESHKKNLGITKRSGDTPGSAYFSKFIDQTEETLRWLSQVRDERVDKYY